MEETTKKDSVVNDAILEAQEIEKTIKEQTMASAKEMVSEGFSRALSKIIKEETDNEEQVEDVDLSTDDTDEDVLQPLDTDGAEGAEDADADDVETDIEDLKVDDDTYNLTGMSTEQLLKVFKRADGNGNVIVKKDGDNISLTDDEANTEYIIKDENIDADDNVDTDADIEVTLDEEEGEDLASDDYILEFDDPEMEGEEDEIDENLTRTHAQLRNSARHTQAQLDYTKNRVGKSRQGSAPQINEGKILKLIEKANKEIARIKKENKELKKASAIYESALNEAKLINVKLGSVVKLVCENSTTASEKKMIVESIDKAKTGKEVSTLYESFNKGLKEITPLQNEIIKEGKTAKKEMLNEQTVYVNNELKEVHDFMNRLNNVK